MQPFLFTCTPRIHFGVGKAQELPRLVKDFGSRVLLVTGASYSRTSRYGEMLRNGFREKGLTLFDVSVTGEPCPDAIDAIVAAHRKENIRAVVAIGGGSAMDTGKAISAMLTQNGSVRDYLEGFESGPAHNGDKVPFLAVPTTAGTGSEATKNAVLSQVGPDGFKRSIRHDNFIPNVAVVDPQLMLTCPADVTAACGMDAFTQLLESYVSTKASPMTDALAWSGMTMLKDSLVPAVTCGAQDVEVRSKMAYSSLLSGITLANAGLGVVHGFASSMGGLFPIPHGVICGTLVGAATRVNIERLQAGGAQSKLYLQKYARVGALLAGSSDNDSEMETNLKRLTDKIEEWLTLLPLPRLGRYGVHPADLDKIAAVTDNKNNPVKLGVSEMKQILAARI